MVRATRSNLRNQEYSRIVNCFFYKSHFALDFFLLCSQAIQYSSMPHLSKFNEVKSYTKITVKLC